jgi:hypothetical protein
MYYLLLEEAKTFKIQEKTIVKPVYNGHPWDLKKAAVL